MFSLKHFFFSVTALCQSSSGTLSYSKQRPFRYQEKSDFWLIDLSYVRYGKMWCGLPQKMTDGDNSSRHEANLEIARKVILLLNKEYLERGFKLGDLQTNYRLTLNNNNNGVNCEWRERRGTAIRKAVNGVLLACAFLLAAASYLSLIKHLRGARCLVPNNYLLWEFTRPISDCDFCAGVEAPLILPNISRDEFKDYAYASRPIVIRGAAAHWSATKILNLKFFRQLYDKTDGAYDEDCQFLHFKSNLNDLRQVLQMSDARAENRDGGTWYVGWKNCHPAIIQALDGLYQAPHFLPIDAEVPRTSYIFMGYDQGALMHVSFDYLQTLKVLLSDNLC